MELQRLKSLVGDGKIFGVKFIRRTDGALRTMACRTGVHYYPPPGSEPCHWEPSDKGLLQVWDVHKRGFRMIPADSVQEVSVRGMRITA